MKDNIKIFFLIAAFSAFLFGYTIVFFLGRPQPFSFSVEWQILPPLMLEVSPKGYPLVGQSWRIFVYEVNASSGVASFQPSSNSTIAVTLRSDGYKHIYYLTADENGQTSFQYLPEYSDIAFQAFWGELSSQKIILSTHYVSSEIVDSLSGFNAFMSVASVFSSGLAIRRRRVGKLMKSAFLFTICLFAFVTFSSLYTKYFQETAWGYPEKIMNGIITLTLLKYVSYSGVVLIIILWTVFWLYKK